MTDDLLYLSARDVRARFASGELDPRAYLDALYARVDRVDGEVGAVTERLEESAYVAADEARERYRAGAARALEGLPVAIKEEHPIAGHVLRLGSSVMPSEVSEASHPVVDRRPHHRGLPLGPRPADA